MTTLIIVESPTKAKALRKYLGSGYIVRASMGHVRDLPRKQLGVDVQKGFKPTYHLTPRARKTLAGLREAADKADMVVLATDPDREGEAIAWHVAQALRKSLRGKNVLRARFHEITPEAVRASVANPEQIDMNLVNAQQARRVLDRLVGYEVSPVLWKGIAGPSGLSAGRVQSVALRLVVERDRQIENFTPEEYWTLEAELSKPGETHFWARLFRVARKKPDLKKETDAHAIVDALRGADWHVADVTQKQRTRKPYPPYITSTLQRDASVRLRWSAKKVMQVAQQLYEGVPLPGAGQVGLITYMRTDSTHVAPEAQQSARTVIRQFYGADALPGRPPVYTKKVKNAQEAHEAIRPTDPARLPKTIREALSSDQDKLYTLIWQRFIASQMKPAIYNVTTVTVHTSKGGSALPYIFRASGRQLLEAGFLLVYDVKEKNADEGAAENETLPPLARGDALDLHNLLPKQHFTKPPPRFTDSALIQELEKRGIGRPSTFANIVDTLYRRTYVRKEKRNLLSTELGRVVCEFLVQHFPDIFEVGFTARMEDRLDEIATGDAQWKAVMAEMWTPLSSKIDAALAAATTGPRIRVDAPAGAEPDDAARKKSPAVAPTGATCPQCGKPLVKRKSKFGEFVGCSGFPKCRYTAKK
ncbi:MAG: type I DNA topoisomerase [Anaerolineales bacterium]